MSPTRAFEIDVEYYHMPRRASMQEQDFKRSRLHWHLPVQQAALVLVDMWSEHYVLSHLARGQQITRERIVPLLEAFRRIAPRSCTHPAPTAHRDTSTC